MANVVYDFSQTRLAVLDDVALNGPKTAFTDLEAEGRETLTAEGVTEDRRRIGHAAEIRYSGQGHTVEVNTDGVSSLNEFAERFEDQHETQYGYTMNDPVQAVHLRVRAVGENDKPELERGTPREDSELTPTDTREAHCFTEDNSVKFDVYRRDDLKPGDEIRGPAVVAEPAISLVFHSNQMATTGDYGHIIIATDQ